MNPLFNPILLAKVAKSYILDVNRIKRYSREKMENYRNKVFLKILKYASKVPLYMEKYRNINLAEIKSLKDLHKLPMITKEDIRKAFPDRLLPREKKKESFSVVSTSGSTGKPVSLFVEPICMFKTLVGFVRVLREYNLSWRRDRIAIIADLSQGSAEEEYFSRTAIPSINSIIPLKNIRVYHVGDNPEEILNDLNKFKPDLIGGYPGILQVLAILKNRGKADNLRPRYIGSSGAVLDNYTRKYIEDAFDARVFEVYGATECSPMAFECKEGNIHIQTDFVNMEFWNGRGEVASPGELSTIIVTCLREGGTPIIRYSGISDLVVPSDKECGCDMDTPLLERIEGRKVDAILLRDGRIIPPSTITGIPYKVMMKHKTKLIEQFQIIQQDYDKIEVLVVINEREDVTRKEKVLEDLERKFSEELGNVDVKVREVREIKTKWKEGLATPPPVVISKVRRD